VYADAVRAKTRKATDKVVAFADGTFKHSVVPELQQDIILVTERLLTGGQLMNSQSLSNPLVISRQGLA